LVEVQVPATAESISTNRGQPKAEIQAAKTTTAAAAAQTAAAAQAAAAQTATSE
jgi:hypothetical protein